MEIKLIIHILSLIIVWAGGFLVGYAFSELTPKEKKRKKSKIANNTQNS